ncbi:peptidylprolyl isomerase [Metabacillus sediminilitoris]|uniref:Peptidyl-prolyl cis-trans isomerase n=1 Tax=Metabacillus sediminilitoris TaxID=2567941 RepID=A0A4S4BX89_9BACI|nr:peptidylprolyl isomerase [Metabacillus sediminilitoris]QGQ46050.1 peptidylprolyl isomerase [Metabacillus sediminilitoris]THF79734.1 peptidylprolyl isomerase [Metabacillus sediminilitoris]
MKHLSKIIYIITVVFIVMIIGGCSSSENEKLNKLDSKPKQTIKDNPVATITMENNDVIKIELYPNIAPNTVSNFITLAESGFYNGVIFHRVIPGFMIQGGDPNGDGTGGPDYHIKGEFTSNGFENQLKHERGIISMARTQAPDTAGSQFFIMVADADSLDGEYAAFGKVTEGMDVVDNIVNAQRDQQDKPLKEQKMKQITIETFGIDYPQPEKIE